MTRRIELDPLATDAREVYFVLSGLVVPRPIAWISTISGDGVANLAPHSYFTIAANHPPHIAFSSTGERDTLRNIRDTGELVVNVVSGALLERMNVTSAEVGPEVDEFALAGVTAEASSVVRPPRVAESPAALECRSVQIVPVAGAHLVIAEVVRIQVSEAVWNGDRVDPALLDPVARLAGSTYATLGSLVRLPRPASGDVHGRDVPSGEDG